MKRSDWGYILLFSLITVPLPYASFFKSLPGYHKASLSTLTGNVAMLALLMFLCVKSVLTFVQAKDFLTKLDKAAIGPVNADGEWLATCQRWKKSYPAVLPHQWEENGETANVYAFVRYLSSRLPENSLTAVSMVPAM